ncbi:MAG: SpoIIE family protein phosphatase [Desulfobacterales bacterium]
MSAQKIQAPVSRELALSKRFADSVLLRQWLEAPESESRRSRFFREADGYQEAFQGGNYFPVNHETRAYYFNGPEKAYSREPRYYLAPDNSDDEWYFTTMEDFDTFTINVNPDVHLDNVQVWINAMVWNESRKIGMAGTGLELTAFLEEFIDVQEPGVTPMILDSDGLIQAHPDQSLIAFGSGAEAEKQESADKGRTSLPNHLSGPEQAERLEQAMQKAKDNPGQVRTLWAGLEGKRQLLALTWLPELGWHVVTAVDLHAANVLEGTWVSMGMAALAVMLAVLLFVFGYGVNRLVLRPLNRLHQSATALAGGDYDVSLPPAGKDEIGDLSRAFFAMVDQVKAYTRNLEEKVRERTKEIEDQSVLLRQARDQAEEASREKTEILDKVMESIHYAQTIQQAILTGEEHLRRIIPESFVLWQPKDVISGDMVWSKTYEDGFALAVMDCTGHGVPGGVMTMAALSSLDRAASKISEKPPGEILCEVSRVVQAMLSSQESSGFSEDGLDMGLCVYSRSRGTLYFAGSRISLIYGGGKGLAEISGDRQSLGYCSSDPDFPFQTHAISIDEPTMFYLVTDGIIDQVGEETGLPLGRRGFVSFLRTIIHMAIPEQKQALREMFEAHQGKEEQSDDVTAVGFRLYQ